MKLKKSMKNRSAVSPVIATILMVAITVVLAAVLYVMVMGFGEDPGNNPNGSIGPAQRLAEDSYKVGVGSITSTEVLVSDCKVNLLYNGQAGAAIDADEASAKEIIKVGTEPNVVSISGLYQDVDGNDKISAGDTILITGGAALPAGNYEVKLLGPNAQIAACTFTVY